MTKTSCFFFFPSFRFDGETTESTSFDTRTREEADGPTAEVASSESTPTSLNEMHSRELQQLRPAYQPIHEGITSPRRRSADGLPSD